MARATNPGAVPQMADEGQLRDRMARLLALALKARERGDLELADQFIDRVLQYEDEVDATEKAAASMKVG
jgi:phage shock protein A